MESWIIQLSNDVHCFCRFDFSKVNRFQSKLKQELERREFTLLKTQQAVKSLEKLKEQRDHSAEVHALAKQQERLDEWASIRHAMAIGLEQDQAFQDNEGITQ